VVPNWAWHEHVSLEDSYLFSTNDLPILEKFNLEHKQTYEKNNGLQTVISEFTPALG
jgi:gentisate 1,2-dioxygenase